MDLNTLYIENVIYIMKAILESGRASGGESSREYLSACSIEGLILNIVRYVRNLKPSPHSIQIKIKVCQLVDAMMRRHDDLTFRFSFLLVNIAQFFLNC